MCKPDKSKKKIVENLGYSLEEHYVATEDGYIITLRRLLNSRNVAQDQKPALYVHGLVESSSDWIITGQNISMGHFRQYDYGSDKNLEFYGSSKPPEYPTYNVAIPVAIFQCLNDFLVTNQKSIVEDYGYSFEEYYVTTDDGYIITVHRLFDSRVKSQSQKPVALCVHGIMGSSVDWFLSGQNVSMAFLLADSGYDVWLFNARGVINSKKHVKYLTSSYKFWDFSGHEIGFYDLPATIDYVLNTTKQPDLFYVGFSQGGGILFIMGSLKPEYNKKIRMAALLAPAVYLGHFRQFDYGKTKNLIVYKSQVPPEYPIHKTDIPIAIFQGLNDIIITSPDIDLLVQKIPNVVYREMITEKKLNHMDLIYVSDMRDLAYSKILNLFETYRKNETLNLN
ncbi:lipase 3-like [Belonocnema kinseyi]|uniref:lipase 3-like n=1 Tax=Belonocnema kinseyi TaxID=2817044 RepID=UPI00143DA1FE|nr:lipase 3-like [Belonocnema kinseyi]